MVSDRTCYARYRDGTLVSLGSYAVLGHQAVNTKPMSFDVDSDSGAKCCVYLQIQAAGPNHIVNIATMQPLLCT